MYKKAVLHIVILLTAVAIIFFWVTNTKLVNFSLQLTAILMLTLIASRHILKPASFRLAESTISTMAVLLVVAATGGINSPLYFFNYFLLFELSLLLEPVIPLVLSGALMFFYLYTGDTGGTLMRWVELSAFPFMTPLAYFFGKIYNKEENQKKEIKNLAKKIEKLEEELVEEELENKQINK